MTEEGMKKELMKLGIVKYCFGTMHYTEKRDRYFQELMAWHLSELKKTELRARIDELGKRNLNGAWRLNELQSKLRKLEET